MRFGVKTQVQPCCWKLLFYHVVLKGSQELSSVYIQVHLSKTPPTNGYMVHGQIVLQGSFSVVFNSNPTLFKLILLVSFFVFILFFLLSERI